MATEEIAADAELDRRDAVGAVGVEQVEHGARVAEYELLHDSVLYNSAVVHNRLCPRCGAYQLLILVVEQNRNLIGIRCSGFGCYTYAAIRNIHATHRNNCVKT